MPANTYSRVCEVLQKNGDVDPANVALSEAFLRQIITLVRDQKSVELADLLDGEHELIGIDAALSIEAGNALMSIGWINEALPFYVYVLQKDSTLLYRALDDIISQFLDIEDAARTNEEFYQ